MLSMVSIWKSFFFLLSILLPAFSEAMTVVVPSNCFNSSLMCECWNHRLAVSLFSDFLCNPESLELTTSFKTQGKQHSFVSYILPRSQLRLLDFGAYCQYTLDQQLYSPSFCFRRSFYMLWLSSRSWSLSWDFSPAVWTLSKIAPLLKWSPANCRKTFNLDHYFQCLLSR